MFLDFTPDVLNGTALNATDHQKFSARKLLPEEIRAKGRRYGHGGRGARRRRRKEKLEERRVRKRHGNIQTFLDKNALGLVSVSLYLSLYSNHVKV